jgi:hypothetical protein
MIMMMNWSNKKFELIFEFDARNKYFRFIFNNLAVVPYFFLYRTIDITVTQFINLSCMFVIPYSTEDASVDWTVVGSGVECNG